jgi:hypothetical protein
VVLSVLILAAPRVAAAQDSTRVRLQVTLSADSAAGGAREPVVRTQHLLNEPRWPAMLQAGFPVRLHYQIEVWRSRAGWFDAFERQAEWDLVVQHEPLLDQYSVITVTGKNRTEKLFATLETAAAALELPYRIRILPAGKGEYYYVASLQVSTLSDSDLDEVERFLEGDLRPAAEGTERLGNAVGRGAKRIVLKLAGVPSLRLEAQSEKFQTAGSGKR